MHTFETEEYPAAVFQRPHIQALFLSVNQARRCALHEISYPLRWREDLNGMAVPAINLRGHLAEVLLRW